LNEPSAEFVPGDELGLINCSILVGLINFHLPDWLLNYSLLPILQCGLDMGLATEGCGGWRGCSVCKAEAEGILPASTFFISLPLSNSRYENLVVALAENTGPNSPDYQQLTRRFLLLFISGRRLPDLYPFLV
jgi:hypothetical protein